MIHYIAGYYEIFSSLPEQPILHLLLHLLHQSIEGYCLAVNTKNTFI